MMTDNTNYLSLLHCAASITENDCRSIWPLFNIHSSTLIFNFTHPLSLSLSQPRRLTDVSQAPVARSAAAAYLASFLARASFVPPSMVMDALQRQVEWCWG